MVKSLVVIAALAVAAPSQSSRVPSITSRSERRNNTPASQNSNGLPFTANDPPASSFHA
jgi:hypothetical protein